MVLFLLLWIAIAFVGIKYKNGEENPALSQKKVMALRGICAVEIMLGHIGIATESIVLYPNRKAGILFVGIFFALSGYGLMYSITNKKNYLKEFLRKRFGKILVPAYFIFLINLIVDSISGRDFNNLIKAVNLKSFMEETNWYVWELLVMYIIFYICAKIDKSLVKSQYLLLVFSLVFICVAFGFGIDNPWYGSTLCFWLGIFYYTQKDILFHLFSKYAFYFTIIGSIFLTFSIGCFFVGEGIVGNLVARNCASMTFSILVIIWLHKFSIGNVVSIWLGKHSYEIFLFHPMLIDVLRPWIKNDVLYTVIILSGTAFFAFAYRKCANLLQNLLIKSKNVKDNFA